jgi:hypothetical protein
LVSNNFPFCSGILCLKNKKYVYLHLEKENLIQKQLKMQVIIENYELKDAVGAFIKENPEMFKNWLQEIVTQNFMQSPHDDDLDLATFRQKYAVKKGVIPKLQYLWKDEASAEDLIKQIAK